MSELIFKTIFISWIAYCLFVLTACNQHRPEMEVDILLKPTTPIRYSEIRKITEDLHKEIAMMEE